MKKILTFFCVAVFSAVTFNLGAQSVFEVQPTFNGTPYGAFNAQVMGDTLPDGSRKDPNRIYKLQRDATYYLSGRINANFDLRLTADPADATHKPPVIASGVSPAGDVVGHLFVLGGNAVFENIAFNSVYPTNAGDGWLGIQMVKDGATIIYDNCIFTGSHWLSMGAWAKDMKVSVTNCKFRNVHNATAVWNGRGLTFQDNNVDTLIMVNNTFFNMNSFALQGQNCTMNYAHFENNTLVNSVKWPIQWEYQTNAVFNNNIFYNIHSFGEGPSERNGQDIDAGIFGIFNLFPLTSELMDSTSYTEESREVKLENNDWFFSQAIKDYWTENDTIDGEPFMNTRTQNMFDNSTLLVESNTMNMDPQFDNAGEDNNWSTVGALVSWMEAIRDTNATPISAYWGYDPDGNRFLLDWPLPENLHYNNATLAAAGTNGCPIGDLNWFPEKKAECTPDVGIQPPPLGLAETIVSVGLSVEQNMPNPFKGQTTIAYSLDEPSNVTVSIIDINGRLITTLVNEKQPQGRHTIDWNAGNQATGVYFYQIKTDKALITRKLELVK